MSSSSYEFSNVSMFTEQQKSVFEQRLRTMLSELEQNQQEAFDAAETVELDQSSVGRLSRMDAMQAQAMADTNSIKYLLAQRS